MGRRRNFDNKSKLGPRRRWRLISASVAVLLLVGGGVGAWRWNAARAAPEPAPRFNLWGSSGRTYTLDDFAGKQEVVLIFYMGAT
jgi:hypothetical protein